jgi:hypothetical protein
MKRYEMIAVAFWMGLAFFSMILSCQLGLGKFNDPGAGLMPFLISLLLFLVSAFLLITFFGKKSQKFEKAREEQGRPNLWRVGLVGASLFAYALLFERLGYITATLLLLILLFKSLGFKWRFVLINSLLSVMITYFLFTYLGIRFPMGILKLGGWIR